MAVLLKSLDNFSNLNPNDPHAFKEELKIKYSTVFTITRRFPGGTGLLEELLKTESPPLDWGAYCALGAPKRLVWEDKAEVLNKAMLLLLNLKNNNAKRIYVLHTPKGTRQLIH